VDKRYAEAETNLLQARQAGEELTDYADFLGAEANHAAGNESAAEALLRGFADRYPDSIFNAQAPELEANVLLALGDAAGAQRVLAANPDRLAVPVISLRRHRQPSPKGARKRRNGSSGASCSAIP